MSHVGRLAFQYLIKLFIRRPYACAHNVFLILARELAACNEQERTVLAWRSTGAITEAAKPDEEIFLEFSRFLFNEPVVRDERDVNQAERFLKNRVHLSLEKILRSFGSADVV